MSFPKHSLNRRELVAGAAALGGMLALPGLAWAQSALLPEAELNAEGALPDIWMGKADAPVTIIEYASLTCSHCAAFHAGTYKELKEKYIDTGKARMTIREFPFDPLAMAGFMLARCQGGEKRGAMIDLLFAETKQWVGDKPLEGLMALTRQAGMSEDAFKKCLEDKELYGKLGEIRDRGAKQFKVSATPTFFINGHVISGNQNLAEFEKVMAPYLK